MKQDPTTHQTRRQAIRTMTATIGTLLLLPALPALADDSKLDDNVRLKHFNISNKSKLAIDGYDPVSYHNGGPRKGSSKRALRYKGVIYYFASETNKETFRKDPAKYEPAYGGWCAWAMLDGDKTDVDPKTYLVINGRTHLFYNGRWGNTKNRWVKRAAKESDAKLIREANKGWSKFTG